MYISLCTYCHIIAEDYSCPPATAKCPESYCIPIRFICDGEMQCPGGEDEYMCGIYFAHLSEKSKFEVFRRRPSLKGFLKSNKWLIFPQCMLIKYSVLYILANKRDSETQ